MADVFDEKALRAWLVEKAGEYGAHVEVFDMLLARIEGLESEKRALLEHIRESELQAMADDAYGEWVRENR